MSARDSLVCFGEMEIVADSLQRIVKCCGFCTLNDGYSEIDTFQLQCVRGRKSIAGVNSCGNRFDRLYGVLASTDRLVLFLLAIQIIVFE